MITISRSGVVELVGPGADRTADPFDTSGAWQIPGPRMTLSSSGRPQAMDPGAVCVRTDRECDQAWARVRGAVKGVVTNGLSNDYDCLDSVELFLFGAYNAARWTLAKSSIAPMSGRPVPFAAGTTRRELAQAEIRMASRAQGWEYATGVMAWLLWIAGTIEDPLPVLPAAGPLPTGGECQARRQNDRKT